MTVSRRLPLASLALCLFVVVMVVAQLWPCTAMEEAEDEYVVTSIPHTTACPLCTLAPRTQHIHKWCAHLFESMTLFQS